MKSLKQLYTEAARLMDERLASIINGAVVQGSWSNHPAPPLKVSRQLKDWKIQVPEHWEEKRLKFLLDASYTLMLPMQQWDQAIVLMKSSRKATQPTREWLAERIEAIKGKYDEPEAFLWESFEDEVNWRYGSEDAGYTSHKEWCRKLSRDAFPNTFWLLLKGDLCAPYWRYYLNSHLAQSWMDRECGPERAVNLEMIGNLPVFVPPFEEQVAIAQYLQQQEEKYTA